MTFPTHVSTTASHDTSFGTGHTFNLPTTAALDVLITIIASGDNEWTPTGDLADTDEWIPVASTEVNTFLELEAYFRLCDGTESGGTITGTTTDAVKCGAVVVRISGAFLSDVEGVGWDAVAGTAGFGTGPNPPAVTATWGSDDNLIVAATVAGGDGATVSAYPASYSGGAQSSAAAGNIAAAASRQLAAASDDPGAFTLSLSENLAAITFIIRPDNGGIVSIGPALEVDAAGAVTIAAESPVVPTFPDARTDVRVRVALGAPAVQPAFEREWTDVTELEPHRLFDQRISIRRGRADESAETQPTSFGFVLDNRDGAFSTDNPESPYWPNFGKGTPVAVEISGTEHALLLDGKPGNYASAADDPVFDLADGFDIRIRLQPDEWSTGVTMLGGTRDLTNPCRLVSKRVSATNDISWALYYYDAGWPGLTVSTNGTSNAISLTSSQLIAGLRPMWLAGIYEPDTGSGSYRVSWYMSDEVVPSDDVDDWQLLQSASGATVGSPFAGAAPVEIGTRDLGTLAGYAGRIFQVQIRDQKNGPLVACPNFTDQTPGTTGFVDDCGITWVLNGDAEISTRRIRAVGTVDSIARSWPYGDNDPGNLVEPSEHRVEISAHGILHRLSQGQSPLRSALYRYITGTTWAGNVDAYWPCEEDGAAAAQFAGLRSHGPMTFTNVDVARDSTLLASAPLPSISGDAEASWFGDVPAGSASGSWSVSMLYRLPTGEPTDPTTLLIVDTAGGSVAQWIVTVDATNLVVTGYNAAGSSVTSTSYAPLAEWYGPWLLGRLHVEEDGADVDYAWTNVDLDTGLGAGLTGTASSHTAGRVARVGSLTIPPPDGLSFGHIAVTDGVPPFNWLAVADTAFVAESAVRRIWRLCTEERIPVEIIGDPGAYFDLDGGGIRGSLARSAPMGPQGRDTLLGLLREAARTDGGVLISRRTAPGIVYRTRASIETQRVQLALDAGTAPGDIGRELEPIDDDQRLRNDRTVTSVYGSSARAVDETSVASAGRYDDETKINGIGGVAVQLAVAATQPGALAAIRTQNGQHAAWLLHLGTWPGARFPTIPVDLALASRLIDDWHDLGLGDRITLDGLPAQWKGGLVDLIVEQIDEQISPTSWRPLLTCSPGGPWLLGRLAEPYVADGFGRLAAGGTATVASTVTATASTIPITGDAFTTDPDAYPLALVVGGELLTAAGYSTGSFTGCTRSLNNVTKPHDAGTDVDVAEPFRLGLGVATI